MKNKSFILGILLAVLLLAGGFAVYGLVTLGFESVLLSIGIEHEAWQYVSIIVLVLLILIFTGVSFKKSLKKLIG